MYLYNGSTSNNKKNVEEDIVPFSNFQTSIKKDTKSLTSSTMNKTILRNSSNALDINENSILFSSIKKESAQKIAYRIAETINHNETRLKLSEDAKIILKIASGNNGYNIINIAWTEIYGTITYDFFMSLANIVGVEYLKLLSYNQEDKTLLISYLDNVEVETKEKKNDREEKKRK
jgi:hypothetical protein